MAKIDKLITRNIKEGNYEDVLAKNSHDVNAKHAHKYPVKIRQTVKEYEDEAGITERKNNQVAKRIVELEKKNIETKISKRKKARSAYNNALKNSVIEEHIEAQKELELD